MRDTVATGQERLPTHVRDTCDNFKPAGTLCDDGERAVVEPQESTNSPRTNVGIEESRDELHLSLPWHSPRSLNLRARRHYLVAPIGAIVDAGVLSTDRCWF